MQNLQRDLAASGVHCLRDDAVLAHLPKERELRSEVIDPPGQVRGKAPRHDQTDTAACALGVESRHTFEAIFLFFQPGVHRTHQRAVAQGSEAEVEGGEQVRVRRLNGVLIHLRVSGLSGWSGYKLSKQALGYCSTEQRILLVDSIGMLRELGY